MEVKEILRQAGYPDAIVVLDFETYYDKDYSLRKLNSYQFINDDRFEVTGLGINKSFYGAEEVDAALAGCQTIFGKNLENCTVVVANASFDVLVLRLKYDFVPKYIVDIQDLSRHVDSRQKHHSVAKMAERFKLTPKGDTDQFKGIQLKDYTSQQLNDLKEYGKHDLRLEKALFYLLLPQLSNASMELRLMQHTIENYVNPKITFDFELAKHLTTEFDKLLAKEIAPCGLDKETLSGNKTFLGMMIKALVPERVPMKIGKKGAIPAFAKSDVGFQNLLAHKRANVRALAEARVAVKSWPSKTGRIKRMVEICDGKYLPTSLRYYSAHTGRFGGCHATNLQNLASRTATELILRMRALLTVQPGQKFVIVDSAQIEARVLAWLANETELTIGFANGEDVYSKFASELFHSVVRKAKKTDPKPVAALMTMRRNFGKMGTLASGFGMGPDTMFIRCLGDPGLKPYFDSGQYDLHFVKSMVKTYRSKHKKVAAFWKTIESAVKFVTKFNGNVASITMDSEFVAGIADDARLTLWQGNDMVHIQLPSGRILYYPHCKVSHNRLSYEHSSLWGGLLTENLCQAIARDLMGGWLLECEERGIPVVLHVHDELVGLVSEEDAESALGLMEEIMCKGPEWAAGLPLSVGDGGNITKEYTK